jgi:hypothetical protein
MFAKEGARTVDFTPEGANSVSFIGNCGGEADTHPSTGVSHVSIAVFQGRDRPAMWCAFRS